MKTVTLVEREDVLVFAADLSAHVGRSVIIPQNGNTFLITVESLNKNGVEAPVDVKLPLPTYVEHKKAQKAAHLLECDECGYTNVDAKAMGGHKSGHTKAQQRRERAERKKRKAKR